MHFERLILFVSFEKKEKKKIICSYPTWNFQTRNPKHTYFFIWPQQYLNEYKVKWFHITVDNTIKVMLRHCL